IVTVTTTHDSSSPPRSTRIRSYSLIASSQYDSSAKSISLSSWTENPNRTRPAKLAAEGGRNFRRSPRPAAPSRPQDPSRAPLRKRSCAHPPVSARRSARISPRSRHRPPLPVVPSSDPAHDLFAPPRASPTAARPSGSPPHLL